MQQCRIKKCQLTQVHMHNYIYCNGFNIFLATFSDEESAGMNNYAQM